MSQAGSGPACTSPRRPKSEELQSSLLFLRFLTPSPATLPESGLFLSASHPEGTNGTLCSTHDSSCAAAACTHVLQVCCRRPICCHHAGPPSLKTLCPIQSLAKLPALIHSPPADQSRVCFLIQKGHASTVPMLTLQFSRQTLRMFLLSQPIGT